MEKRYLYPAYPIIHIGIGDGYVEYPLSRVLATYGGTIRFIRVEDTVNVLCYFGGDGKRTNSAILEIPHGVGFEAPVTSHFYDAIIRYKINDGKISEPVCVGLLLHTAEGVKYFRE